MSEKISVMDFTDNDKQCVSSPYHYVYNNDDDHDDKDDDANDIRWNTSTESKPRTTPWRLKGGE
eukprot:15561166-Heterocapsa_arctica.AAC.1